MGSEEAPRIRPLQHPIIHVCLHWFCVGCDLKNVDAVFVNYVSYGVLVGCPLVITLYILLPLQTVYYVSTIEMYFG